MASNIYFTTEAPYFETGYGVSFVLLLMTGMIGTLMFFLLKRENKKREEGRKGRRIICSRRVIRITWETTIRGLDTLVRDVKHG